MAKKVGIGIIGTGFARTVQIPAFQKIDGAQVVSVASARRENAEKAARDFNIPHWTGDWRETIERADVDLICITTPPVFHREMTLYALERGRHVLCEKPMAMNAGEASEMWEKSKEKNVLAVIDHELRYLNGRRRAFEMIRAGEIGKIRHVKYNFRAPHRGNPDAPWNWWSDETQGGGALGAIVSHIFDSVRWFTGAEISKVFCQMQTHVKRRRDDSGGELREVTSDDESNLILRFADNDLTEDATANISTSMVEYPAYQNRIELFGTAGAIRVEYDGELFVGKPGDAGWQKIEMDLNDRIETAPNTGWNNGFLVFAREIVKTLQAGETEVENAATFEDGYKIQIALDAARESNASGCAVKL
ncbi:MAG TPA: Gfo/Idh/MocA family oxidoreductase [Pyrinomonadaceae bacterium]|jgi:predicted dehydrogenase